jgi:hypothetical protein
MAMRPSWSVAERNQRDALRQAQLQFYSPKLWKMADMAKVLEAWESERE